MQRLQGLLVDGLDGHGGHTGAAIGFEHRFRIGAVGLVAAHVGPHVLDRDQADGKSTRLAAAPPVVRGAAGLHHHRRPHGEAVDKGFELPSRQPFSVDDSVRPIRQCHLEDVLCQIHRHRRSIHVGLLLVVVRPTVHGNDAAKEPGGVHTITAPVGG